MKVILHPTASIAEIRRGLDSGSDDSVDLSDFVTQGSHSAFEASVTLSFNRELFGDSQPKPSQILEIQLEQDDEWKACWLGVVDSISSFTLQRGTRSMQLNAKSRDSQDIWRNTKRITPLFPQLTDFTYIIQRVARSAGMQSDEIVLPYSSFTTAHSNTQLADMNAWDMIASVCTACGWTPFIDVVGRLRVADRGLQGRIPDVVLADARLVKVGGQRQRPPKSRVRVLWLNPTLKKNLKQGQKLTEYPVTLGWFIPILWKHVSFSSDKTQRAESTYFKANPSCNSKWSPHFVRESYIQQSESQGKLKFINFSTFAMAALIASWYQAHSTPDGVAGVHTVPIGRKEEAIYQALFCYIMTCVGTGVYEIWGNPFDWVHARNTSEAFDSSVPDWVDNTVDIETDFVVNEEHAKAIAIRELIYQAREANKWQVTLVDDPRIEYGDILQFTDGSQIYVEDFTRSVERGSEATLDVKGFLVPVTLPSTEATTTESPDAGSEETGTIDVPVIDKACWMGWFEFTDTLTYDPPHNCAMWVTDAGAIKDASNVKFAQWVQGSTVADINTQVAGTTGPAVAYWDARTWPTFPTLRAGDWLAIQAYCFSTESAGDFETNIKAVLTTAIAAWPKICLVCQCYTSNTTLTANLGPLVPVYARLARDFPAVTMMLVFSDQGRATGLNDHQTVEVYWTDLFDGITGTP